MKFQNFIEKNKYLLLIIAILLILLLGKTNTRMEPAAYYLGNPAAIPDRLYYGIYPKHSHALYRKKTAPSKIEQISNFHSNHQFFINAIDRSCCHLADAVFYDPAADTKLFHAQ